jgi:hypothetical protein
MSQPAEGPQPPDDGTREKVFEKSYDEVLLFLKHQDDKINRVLTALAFLTAAGVTLYIFSRSDTAASADFPTVANVEVHMDDYFFASFIIGVAVSVALALVSLDPTSFVPHFFGHHHQGAPRKHSLLYYDAIARHEDRDSVYDEPNSLTTWDHRGGRLAPPAPPFQLSAPISRTRFEGHRPANT